MSPTAPAPARLTQPKQTSQAPRFWHSAWHAALGSVALGVVTLVGFLLQADTASAALLYLFVIVITSLRAGRGAGLVASVVAIVCLDYFFTPPLHTLNPGLAQIPHLLTFGLIGALSAAASASRRNAERSLQQARDDLEVRVQERTADLTELAGRLINAQEQERSRIGRELHDHISQMLGVLTIRMDQLRVDPATPASVATTLEELRKNAAEITDDIHGLSHRLHSSTLDYLGLVAALKRLVTEFSARHAIDIELSHAGIPETLPSEVALGLFRVTEESLANIAKHSGAKTARVALTGATDGIHLTIEDQGHGFEIANANLERKEGLGFVSMRERLRALGGTVHVDSALARGTRIDVLVPVGSLETRVPLEPVDAAAPPGSVSGQVGTP